MHSTGPQTSVLLGRHQLELSLRCLASFLRFNRDPTQLVVHDDGTLDAEACDRLYLTLPGVEIVARATADEQVRPQLSRHPHCARFREEYPLGRKLIDLCLLARDGVVHLIDSDILFMRPFTGLFAAAPACDAVFMQDLQSAYSVDPLRPGFVRQLQLPARVNLGIARFGLHHFDLDRLEALLGEPRFWHVPYFVEQTAWAALAPLERTALFDTSQIEMMQWGSTPRPERVAGHFSSPWRALLERWPDSGDAGETPVAITAHPAPALSALGYACRRAQRRISHRLGLDVWRISTAHRAA